MLREGVLAQAPRRRLVAALLLCALLLCALLPPTAAWAQTTQGQPAEVTTAQIQSAQGPTSSYQGPLLPDPRLRAVETVPVWRDRLDNPTALVTDTAVVYLRDGRLVATELSSGWQQWAYGSGLTGPLLLARADGAQGEGAEDRVIVAEGGRVTALNATTGAHLWSTEVTALPVHYLQLSGEALLVGSGAEFTLVELGSGRTLHELTVAGSSEPLHADGGVVIFRSWHGEPGVQLFHAFSTSTGQELWQSRAWARLLGVEEGRAYLLNQLGSPSSEERFSLSVVDVRSGVRLEHWSYGMGGAGPAPADGSGARFMLTDDALYLVLGASGTVHRFPRGGAEAPAATYAPTPSGAFLTGPHLGLLFFESDDHSLVAARVSDGTVVRYLGAGTPISRLDLVDRRAYVGRTGGTFVALELDTARLRYMLATGGVGFGPTLRAGAYLVVQGSSELLVLEALR